MNFSKNSVKIDPAIETDKIVFKLKIDILKKLKKKGAFVGISSGIDS